MDLYPIYYDTETTGIKPEKDRIVELAAFDPVRNRTFSTLINPQMPIPPEATAIHQITDEMVLSAPPFPEVSKKFIEFCAGPSVLIAHNNDLFDLPFLREEFLRNGIEMPTWRFLDSLKWARKYRYDLPRHSLQYLREVYGISANQAHRALDDVMVLHQVFSKMLDDIPLETALTLLKAAPQTLRMTFGKYQGQALETVPKHYVAWLEENGVLKKSEHQELRKNFQKLGFLT